MRIATPAFFCFPFVWNIFFHLLTFSLYVPLGLKLFSCRQHIYASCVCIHLASLYLLVGAFNPFTFKVIIDMYVPITIFLIILGLLFVIVLYCYCCFPSLVFPAYRSSFSICCKAGLVVLNSLSFCLYVKVLIYRSNLNEILPG